MGLGTGTADCPTGKQLPLCSVFGKNGGIDQSGKLAAADGNLESSVEVRIPFGLSRVCQRWL